MIVTSSKSTQSQDGLNSIVVTDNLKLFYSIDSLSTHLKFKRITRYQEIEP